MINTKQEGYWDIKKVGKKSELKSSLIFSGQLLEKTSDDQKFQLWILDNYILKVKKVQQNPTSPFL